MPLVGFKCPICRNAVGWGHFDDAATMDCRKQFPAWAAERIRTQAESDVRHSGLDITASSCYGCPRAQYLKTQFDYIVDPQKYAAMVRGTANHEIAANAYPPEWWYTEETDEMRMTLEGVLFGVRISAKADAIRRDFSVIVDNKFPKDWNVTYRGKGPKFEHEIQMNVIRLLLAQQQWALDEGYDPDKVELWIWDHGLGRTEGFKVLVQPHRTEEQMLALSPCSGVPTVREILEAHLWMQEEHKAQGANATGVGSVERERVAAALPLIGETQFNADRCSKYCDVSALCESLTRKYGRPEEYDWVDAPGVDGLGQDVPENERPLEGF